MNIAFLNKETVADLYREGKLAAVLADLRQPIYISKHAAFPAVPIPVKGTGGEGLVFTQEDMEDY